MVGVLFGILLFASCGYACLAGGRDGRWTTVMLISAAVLTIPASKIGRGWEHTQLPILGVDLLLLIGLGWIAARSRSFWPLWFFGLHLANVSTHLATLVLPSWRPAVYYALQSFWAVPELLIMVVGIMLDQRSKTGGGQGDEVRRSPSPSPAIASRWRAQRRLGRSKT